MVRHFAPPPSKFGSVSSARTAQPKVVSPPLQPPSRHTAAAQPRMAPHRPPPIGGKTIQRMETSPLDNFLRDGSGKPIGQGLTARNPNTNTNVEVYHVTKYGNLLGIIGAGLDPDFGGGNTGASVLDVSPTEVQQSKEGSKGFVTVATKTFVASSYALKFDTAAEGTLNKPLREYAVVLRIRNAELFPPWRNDPKDKRGNKQTSSYIPSGYIDYLTFSGWEPINSIDKADLRDALRGG